MANVNCGVDAALVEAYVRQVIQELLAGGQVQPPLNDCSGSPLTQGTSVAKCSDIMSEAQIKALVQTVTQEVINSSNLQGALQRCDGNPMAPGTQIPTCLELADFKLEVLQAIEANGCIFKDCNGQPICAGATLVTCSDFNDFITNLNAQLAGLGGSEVLAGDNIKVDAVTTGNSTKYTVSTDLEEVDIVAGDNIKISENAGQYTISAHGDGELVTEDELNAALAGVSSTVTSDESLTGDGSTATPLSVVFATEAEIDTGGYANAKKAVGAEEYADEIYVGDNGVRVGRQSYAPQLQASSAYTGTLVGNNALNRATVGSTGELTIVGKNASRGIASAYKNVIIGENALDGYTNRGAVTAQSNVIVGAEALSSLDSKVRVYASVVLSADATFDGDTLSKSNLIGGGVVGKSEENHTVIGSPQHANIYTTATYHGAGFVTNSDQRIKQVGDLVNTMANGIEVRKFTYLSNGTKHVGWVAQQVKALLEAKGYDEEVICAALPCSKDIDWHATIAKFNGETGSSITLWTEAAGVLETLKAKLLKAKKYDVTADEFLSSLEAADEVTEAEQALADSLRKLAPESYFVYAEDIMGINKQLVSELL